MIKLLQSGLFKPVGSLLSFNVRHYLHNSLEILKLNLNYAATKGCFLFFFAAKNMNKVSRRGIGMMLIISIFVQILAPLATLANPQTINASDSRNALETVGTKVNRQKTVGQSGVDESSGAFTYSYPFSVPNGKFGLEPEIVISYNSQSSENSMVGYGMNLSTIYIERTNKNGSDKMFNDNDSFVSSMGGELVLKSGTSSHYLQKFDDGSYQLYTNYGTYWTMIDRSANIYTFGQTTDSKLCDDACTKVSRYYLTSVKDMLGNQVKYFYEKKNNIVYPKQIAYTLDRNGQYANVVTFEREPRPDIISGYQFGFLSAMTDRIKTIKTFTNGVHNGSLTLNYATGQNGYRTLLSTVSESRLGTNGEWSTLPDTKFNYTGGADVSTSLVSKVATPGYMDIDITGDAKPERIDARIGGSGINYIVLDINGDYVPDKYNLHHIVGWYGWEKSGNYYKNTTGTAYPISSLNVPASYSTTNNLSYPNPRMTASAADVNADGLQDLLGTSVLTTGVYLNTGGNFAVGGFGGFISMEDQLVDFNGDGLPDKVAETGDVYLNNGQGWNSTPDTGFKIIPKAKLVPLADSGYLGADAGVRFMDVNLDGLPDVVRSYNANITPYWQYSDRTGVTQGTAKELYLNTGTGFVAKPNPNFGSMLTIDYQRNNSNWNSPYVVPTNYYWTEGLKPARVDVLTGVVGTLGGKLEVTYDYTANGNVNPQLPINMMVVSEIKETEVVNNLVETTKYAFSGGKMYYDANNIRDRRFAGFKSVRVEKGNQVNINYFHQGDGDDAATYERGDSVHLIGKSYLSETRNLNNFLTNREHSVHGVYTYDGQIFQYLKSAATTTFDTAGGIFSTAETYDYDLASRLPKEVIKYGRVNYDIANNIITDIDQDLVRTVLISTNSRPQKFLAEEKYDINDKFLDKTVKLYDNLPFGFVEKGLLTEERNYTDGKNYVTTKYAYNNLGLPEKVTDAMGNVTVTKFDTANNVSESSNALGQRTTFVYDAASGQLLKSTSPSGKVAEMVYDGFGNAIEVKATSPKTDQLELQSKTTYSYGNGLTVEQTTYLDGSTYNIVKTTHDSFGRQIKQTDSAGANNIIAFNNLGQVISVTDVNGLQSKFVYDDWSRVVEVAQGDNKLFTTYGVLSKRVFDNSTSVAKHAKIYGYNAQGQLTQVTEEAASGNLVTNYTWNLLGGLTKIVDAEGNVRNFVYDGEGRLLRQEDLHKPDDTTYGVYGYEYDALNRVVKKTDAIGNVFSYKYDALGRPVWESDGDLTTVYSYDTCANGVGQLCAVKNSDYEQTMAYNLAGHITSETKNIDVQLFTHQYYYDGLGRLARVVLPDGGELTYTYNINGKQQSVALNGQNIVSDASYNLDKSIKSVTAGNNVKTCYNYSTTNGGNTAPRLSEILVSKPGQNCAEPLYQQKLTYNLFGSIVGSTEVYDGQIAPLVNTYSYDDLERLIKVNDEIYAYSPIGNLTSANGQTYVYDAADYKNPNAPSIIGTTRMAYDLNGNVLDDGFNKYSWTKDNRLKTADSKTASTSYVYDVNGERLKETVKLKDENEDGDLAANIFADEPIFTSDVASDAKYVSAAAYAQIKPLFPNDEIITTEKIKAIMSPVYTSKFVYESCKNIAKTDADKCARETTLKALYAKIDSEKNVKLSFGALQELWLVHNGKLVVPADPTVYTSLTKTVTKVLNEKAPLSKTFYTYLPATGTASYNDYSYSSTCQIGLYATYMQGCGYVLESLGVENTTDYTVSKAEFKVVSQHILPANYLRVSALKNIDLNNAVKFEIDNSDLVTEVSKVEAMPATGYHYYVADVTAQVQKWNNFNSAYTNGFFVSPNLMNSGYSITTSHYGYTNIFKSTVNIEFTFVGKFNDYLNVDTMVLAEDAVADYYAAFTKGVVAQTSNSKPIIYISEKTYTELQAAKLTKINQINVLFDVALDTDYLRETCIMQNPDCLRTHSIKYVAGYLDLKHAIKLSATALEEMYGVYKGTLTLPQNNLDYEKYAKGGYGYEESVNIGNNCNPLQTGRECQIYFGFKSDDLINKPNLRAYLSFDINPTANKAGYPVSFKATDPFTGKVVDPLLLTDPNKNGSYVLDFTPVVESFKTNYNRGTTIWIYAAPKNVPTTNTDPYMYISKPRVFTADWQYKNSINNPSAAPTITGLTDKTFLSYLYRESKIASLFPNPKLISTETFAELKEAGLSYSNLVIYDRLIAYNFAPYTPCESFSGDAKNLCKKEVFVKYLYSVVDYVKDKKLSAAALDEIYEAMQGNLTVPNNDNEYTVKEVKKYNFAGTYVNHNFHYNYSATFDNFTNWNPPSCALGYVGFGQMWADHWCDYSFSNIPPEVLDRKNTIETVHWNMTFQAGRESITGGMSMPMLYEPPVIQIGDLNDSKKSYDKLKPGEITSYDITHLINTMLNSADRRVRLSGDGHSALLVNPTLVNWMVTYAWPADSINRAQYQPLVANPLDSRVSAHVLAVLARIDREVNTKSNTIVSEASYNEFKLVNLLDNAGVVNLFTQNEQLQKDETLAVVWQNIYAQHNIKLTREALEELYLVWQGKLQMPVDAEQYGYVVNTKIKHTYDPAIWTVYSVNNLRTVSDKTCMSQPDTTYCRFVPPSPWQKPYVKVVKAVFNGEVNGQSTNDYYFDVTKNKPVNNALLAELQVTAAPQKISLPPYSNYNVPLVVDLTKLYIENETTKYPEHGFIVTVSPRLNNIFCLNNIANSTCYIDYEIAPNFTVFDRDSLEVLSVVPGVPSVRTLVEDAIFAKQIISIDTQAELTKAGIGNLSDLGIAEAMSKTEKLEKLRQVYITTKATSGVALSREALEEIYYWSKDMLVPVGTVGVTGTFDRLKLGQLEPIIVDGKEIYSANEFMATHNTAITSELKVISDDTRAELLLAGISSKQQVVDIMAGTNTVLKDSKMGYFYGYAKDKLNYQFSRAALEEIYMLYSGRALWGGVGVNDNIIELNTYVASKPEWAGTSTRCAVGRGMSIGYYGCAVVFDTPQKEGYKIVSETMNYLGGVPNNLGGVNINVNGQAVPNGAQLNHTANTLQTINLGRYASTIGKITTTFSSNSIYNTEWVMNGFEVRIVYQPITAKFDRNDFASLSDVSPIQNLVNSYQNEVALNNFVPKIITPVSGVKTTPETLAQFSTANLILVSDINELFANLDAKLVTKEAKLYGVYLAVKADSGIELTRQALEEAFNINAGTQYLQSDKASLLPQANVVDKFLYKRGSGNAISSFYSGGTITNANEDSRCYLFNHYQSACILKFGFKTRGEGWNIKRAILNSYYASGYGGLYNLYMATPTALPQAGPAGNYNLDNVDLIAKITVPATLSSSVVNSKTDITNLYNNYAERLGTNKQSTDYDLAIYRNLDTPATGSVWQVHFITPYDGWSGYYGVQDPYIEVEWEHTDPFAVLPDFAVDKIYEALTESDINGALLRAYNAAMNITNSETVIVPEQLEVNNLSDAAKAAELAAKAAVASANVEPVLNQAVVAVVPEVVEEVLTENAVVNSENSAPEITELPSTETSIAENIILQPAPTETIAIDPPAENPHNYAWIYDEATQKNIFYLPDGTTTTDPHKLPVSYIPEYLNKKNAREYSIYYPSPYYQYDTRGVVTINVLFNGQVVAEARYLKNNSPEHATVVVVKPKPAPTIIPATYTYSATSTAPVCMPLDTIELAHVSTDKVQVIAGEATIKIPLLPKTRYVNLWIDGEEVEGVLLDSALALEGAGYAEFKLNTLDGRYADGLHSYKIRINASGRSTTTTGTLQIANRIVNNATECATRPLPRSGDDRQLNFASTPRTTLTTTDRLALQFNYRTAREPQAVEFLIDNVSYGVQTQAPYRVQIDQRALSVGVHNVTTKIVDYAGVTQITNSKLNVAKQPSTLPPIIVISDNTDATSVVNSPAVLTIYAEPAAQVFYTTDGSTPATQAGGSTFAFTSPQIIAQSSQIRAVAVMPTGTASATIGMNVTVVPAQIIEPEIEDPVEEPDVDELFYNPLLPTKQNPEVSFLHLNYLGTPVIATNKDGAITQSTHLDAWGNKDYTKIDGHVVTPTTRGYTNHQYDAHSNLTYAHARYLNTTTHLWLSQDPMMWNSPAEQNLQNPQVFNAYSYVANNPINSIDPNGEEPFTIGAILLGTWAVAEFGLSAYDVYTTARLVLNPNVSIQEKSTSMTLTAAGIAGPGGGYKTIGDNAVKLAGKSTIESLATKKGALEFIDASEAKDLGHTIAKHVGQTDGALVSRAKADPALKAVSTFKNKNEAAKALVTAVKQNKDEVVKFVNSSSRKPLPIIGTLNSSAGKVYTTATKTISSSNLAQIVLGKTKSGVTYLKSMYPTIKK